MTGNQSCYLALVQVRTKTHPVELLLTKPSTLVGVCPPRETGCVLLMGTQAPYGLAAAPDPVLQLSVHLG